MKKTQMTEEDLDNAILNRVPNCGCHHYDGIYFFLTLIAECKRKKRLKLKKLNKNEKKFKPPGQETRINTIQI